MKYLPVLLRFWIESIFLKLNTYEFEESKMFINLEIIYVFKAFGVPY